VRTSDPGPAGPAHEAGPVEIIERPYDHADAVRLLQALYEEQVGRYGFADPVEADPAAYQPPQGLFLVAYVHGVPSACGGYRAYRPDRQVMELKKMYTVPQLRGHGVGRLMLDRLERAAARSGARRAILETGARSHAALALVRRAGYRPTAGYVPGRDPAINRAFLKDLSATAGATRPGRRATAR
jgi:GNAT superfamily N-acetyltransferase